MVMNIEQLAQQADDLADAKLQSLGEYHPDWHQVRDEYFAQQIIGETILQILATDTRDLVYTTFDRDRAEGIISRVVDQVRNHWSQP
jgi:hypothetical protein